MIIERQYKIEVKFVFNIHFLAKFFDLMRKEIVNLPPCYIHLDFT